LIAFLVVSVAAGLGWLRGLDSWLLGGCYAVRGELPPEPGLVIIAVDVTTERQLGSWPWTAERWTQVLRTLRAAGVTQVVLDLPNPGRALQLAQPNRSGLQGLQAELAAGQVVLPFAVQEGEEDDSEAVALLRRFACGEAQLPSPPLETSHLSVPPREWIEAAAGLGSINIYPDLDGLVRSNPLLIAYGNTLYPSLALEVLRLQEKQPPGSPRLEKSQVQVGTCRVPVSRGGEIVINYAGGYLHYPRVSLGKVMSSRPADLQGQLQGRIALVGPVQGELITYLRTPLAARMPGVEVQANALGSLLREDYLRPVSLLVLLVVIGVCCLLAAGLAASTHVSRIAGVTVVLAGLVWLVGYLLFRAHLWLPLGAPLLGVLITGIALATRQAASADRQKAQAEARLQSRLQAIAGIGGLIDSRLDRQSLLNEIMRWVDTELNVEACSLLLLDKRTQTLHFEVARGPKGDLTKDFTLNLGEGIVGIVAQNGKPLIINNARDDPRRHQDIPKAISYDLEKVLCVPMTYQGEVVGVLEAMNKRDNSDFTEYDAQLLTVIAQEASLFLENARLYGVLQQRVDFANAELRQAMRELEREKAKVETLVEEMADGVLATDMAGRIALVNSAAREMLGLSRHRLDGEAVSRIVPDERLAGLFQRTLSAEGGMAMEEIDLSGDNTRVVRVTVALIEDQAGERVGKCAVLTDITHFKKMDQMKNDLISFVSHELKTPLTTLGLYADMLQMQLEGGHVAESLDAAVAMDRQVKRMANMVEDFLNVSRIEAGRPLDMQPEVVDDVRELVAEVITIESGVTAEHSFHQDFPQELPKLWADRGKLLEIFINLVNNAIKYSPDGGEITVFAQVVEGAVQFSVRDTGIGISPEEQAVLFQRFQRVNRDSSRRIRGTGLGLFVCKSLVEAHGGQIWLESQAGAGSTFYFTIPVYSGQDEKQSG
jgi:two-component system phosphate regulon sensor histidine kinase PhoR